MTDAIVSIGLISVWMLLPTNTPGQDSALTFGLCIAFVVALIINFTAVIQLTRLHHRLRTTPNLCLHCLYPLEPTTPHCPECSRLNNRQDLNEQWSKLLE